MTRKHNRRAKRKTQKKRGDIHGKRYPTKNGWIRIQIWGNAFERGYAHGHLLCAELRRIREVILPFLVKTFYHVSYDEYERLCHTQVFENIRTEYPEFFEELSGIAAGSKMNLDFIIAWNCHLSMSSFFKREHKHKKKHHGAENDRCSAFIAVGDATETGEIVMAHNTHSDFVSATTFNVILEIDAQETIHDDSNKKKPKKIKMQTAPGFIASGSDWFMCGSGIIGCETTIGGMDYKPDFSCKKTPYFCRVRQAMQYADSLDEFVTYMKKGNAGDYACSWLLGHTKSGIKPGSGGKEQEIMLFELGLNTENIERKTNGVFYGMNAAISPEIREKETKQKGSEKFWDMNKPSGARNIRFHFLLYEKYYGKIGVANARTILADHYDVSTNQETKGNGLTICRHANLETRIAASPRGAYYPWGCTDGKVVSSSMAKRDTFLGRWGPTCGHAFSAKTFIEKHPKFKKWSPVLPNMPTEPWITL